MRARTFPLVAAIAALSAVLLTACGPEAAAEAEAPRAVKLETAGRDARAANRFVATVRQEQRADLAFENGGRVAAVLVDVGDRVREGQVLARLEQEPLRLRLRQAQAQEQAASAQLEERRTQWRQQQALLADGAISEATLASATTALQVAESQLRSAASERALAERALDRSELRAPFAGDVVARLAQPHADAAAGQAVLQMEGIGHPQVTAALPADVAAALAPGSLVHAQRADLQDGPTLRLRGVSPRLDGGASLQSIFDVVGAAPALRSGDSLLLTLGDDSASGPSVPLSAVVARIHRDSAAVFVYRPGAGVVVRREVALGAVRGDRVQVLSGLAAGEQVVAAGAAFLADGQKVTPFRAESRLASGGDS